VPNPNISLTLGNFTKFFHCCIPLPDLYKFLFPAIPILLPVWGTLPPLPKKFVFCFIICEVVNPARDQFTICTLGPQVKKVGLPCHSPYCIQLHIRMVYVCTDDFVLLERITYRLAVMMYCCLHSQAPQYLADHLMCSSQSFARCCTNPVCSSQMGAHLSAFDGNLLKVKGNNHLTPASDVTSRLRLRSANRQLLVPLCQLDTYGRRAFTIAGPTVWNSLPDELKDPMGAWF